MSFDWFLKPVTEHYVDFEGRATRQAFWMYVLYYVLIYIAVAIVGSIVHFNMLTTLLALALFLPNLAIGARRLHDIGKSGWWQLIGIIPILGLVVLIYFFVQKGQVGPNEYGADPKAGAGMPATPVEPATSMPAAEAAEDEQQV